MNNGGLEKVYRVCLYNTETEKVLYRNFVDHRAFKWDYHAPVDHNKPWRIATIYVVANGMENTLSKLMKDFYYKAITSELQTRKKYITVVPIESDLLRFDLAERL